MNSGNKVPTTPHSLTLTVQQVIEHMLDGVLITDSNSVILSANKAFSSSCGYQPNDLIGKNPSFLKSGKHKPAFFKKMWTALENNGFWQGEIINNKKGGEEYTEWATITSLKNSDGRITNYMAVYTDISNKKKAEETIKFMSTYDLLTGLPNRNLFRDRLKQSLLQMKRQGQMLAVLFLDLDRVKLINDTLGHNVGDLLLKAVGERLVYCLREGDTVARLGGDEFMVLLPGIDHVSDVSKLTEKILEALRPSFRIRGHDLYITASIGISISPFDGVDADTLSKNADTAMYRAKKHGRNNYQVFTPSMTEEVCEQLELGNNLRKALDNKEFVLHYQPQLSIKTGEMIGMEALVRWNHPEMGMIPPKKFIEWAEDSGFIIPLGEWVLREACAQNRAWQHMGLPRLRVAVNLSANQFKDEEFVHIVEKTLEDTSLAPDCLDLELTESVVMDNVGRSLRAPHDLKAMGIKFSIDDFGTGYSSLSYLKHFPVHTLKMDQSFVRDLSFDPNDAAIATAVIALGHSLNVTVLAEGVETEQQLEVLRQLHCDKMQGYLFSRPLDATAFENLLRSQKDLNGGTLFEQIPA